MSDTNVSKYAGASAWGGKMATIALEALLARESIRQTMLEHTVAGDRLRVDDFVAVFAEDAVLESDGVSESDAFRYVGRQAIRDWIVRWSRSSADALRALQATFVCHHLSTSPIELTGAETANARTYWVAYADIGPDHCGITAGSVSTRTALAYRTVRPRAEYLVRLPTAAPEADEAAALTRPDRRPENSKSSARRYCRKTRA